MIFSGMKTYSTKSLYTIFRPVGSLTSNQVVLNVPNLLVAGSDQTFSCVVVIVLSTPAVVVAALNRGGIGVVENAAVVWSSCCSISKPMVVVAIMVGISETCMVLR